MLIVGNGSVITGDETIPLIVDGAVAIDQDRIQEVGSSKSILKKYSHYEYIDANKGIIMPGFINCHTHIYSGLARGLVIDGCNPSNFLENLEQQWWRIDRNLSIESIRASAYATILECIRNGVTTIFDHHASYGEIPGSLFSIKDVLQELGMRACLCYEVSDRDGLQKRKQAIQENVEFCKWISGQDTTMIAAMFGGHAPFTLSDETMNLMVEANQGRVGFHIHVCEGMNDVWDSRKNRGGTSPVERLFQHGLLGPKTLLAHCIHVTPFEMDIIQKTNTHIVNNPQSNMNNAVGCAPVLEFLRKGIDVCLGSDAFTHDMLESLKTLVLIQRHNLAMPNVAWSEAMNMLFENNSDMASSYFSSKLGKLVPNALADLVVMDYKNYTPVNNENIGGHILFGLTGKNCVTTIINGKVIYKDRSFVQIDEERINAWIYKQAIKLWGEINHCVL